MSNVTLETLPQAGGFAPSAWKASLAEGSAILRLAVPIALIALVNMGMSVTDTVMVSMLFGTDALAGVAVGSDLYSILFYLCAGILAGVTPFYTAAVTHGDGAGRRRLLGAGWRVVALLSVIAVPLLWSAPDWLTWFGLAPDLLEEGRGYSRTMALTFVPMLGVMLFRTVLTAAEKPKVFLKVTLSMLPLNAAANYIFMTGLGPLPAFGPTGAGIATFLVALASLAALAIVARRSEPREVNASLPDRRQQWNDLGNVLRVGLPIGIATVTEVGIYLAATLYAARLGAADVAAHTLTLRVAGIAYAVPSALLQAAMVRMARAESLELSAQRRAAGRAVISGSLGIAVLCGGFLFLLIASLAAPLADAFFDLSADGRVAAGMAIGLLALLAFIEGVANPGLAAAGILRGRKDTGTPMAYTLVSYWLIGAPLGIALCENGGIGVTGLWIGLAAGTAMTALLTLARLYRTSS